MRSGLSATRCLIVLCLAGTGAAFGSPITSTWTGGSGSWSNSAKWANPPGPPAAGYQVLIDNGNPLSSSVLVDVVTPILNNLAVDNDDAISVQQSLSAGTVRSFGGVTVLNGGVLNAGSGGFVQDQSSAITTVAAGGQFSDTGSYSQGNGSTSVAGTLSAQLFHVTGGSVTAANGGLISLGSGGYTQDLAVTTKVDAGGQLILTGDYSQGNGSTAVNGTLTAALFHVTGGSVEVGSGGTLELGSGGYTQGITGTTTTIDSGGQLTVSGGTYSQELGTTTTVNGTLTANTINNSGTIVGNGTIDGNLNDLGTLSPGNNGVGSLAVVGSYSQSGFLDIDIAGANLNDLVSINGPASLGGTLAVDLLGGFVPTLGSTFDVMSYSSLSGEFNAISDGGLSPGEFWQAIYGPQNLYLTVATSTAVPEPGSWGLVLIGAGLLMWGRSRSRP